MWNPYEKLQSALASVPDTSFVRVFVDGDEVQSIDDVPRHATEGTHVVAYSKNYEFYRVYLPWTGMAPRIQSTRHAGDPCTDVDVNPLRRSAEMPQINKTTSYLSRAGEPT